MQTIHTTIMVDNYELERYVNLDPLIKHQLVHPLIKHQLVQLMLKELEQYIELSSEQYPTGTVFSADLRISTPDDFKRYEPGVYIQKCLDYAKKELEIKEPSGIISELEIE